MRHDLGDQFDIGNSPLLDTLSIERLPRGDINTKVLSFLTPAGGSSDGQSTLK